MSASLKIEPSIDTTVILTAAELQIAAFVAAQRQIENLMLGRSDAHGCKPSEGWQTHAEGALGELAVAKWLGKFWSGNLGNLKADDVGSLQVRTATSHSDSLILHRRDPDDRAFILVTGVAPRLVLRGWMWARDGKHQRWWRDPKGGRPAFFVPQSELRPMRRPVGSAK